MTKCSKTMNFKPWNVAKLVLKPAWEQSLQSKIGFWICSSQFSPTPPNPCASDSKTRSPGRRIALCRASERGTSFRTPYLQSTPQSILLYTDKVHLRRSNIPKCISSVYIYIYTRNAWVLPRRCSVEVSHSQTNDVANYRNSYGENNKGTRDY